MEDFDFCMERLDFFLGRFCVPLTTDYDLRGHAVIRTPEKTVEVALEPLELKAIYL